jgi:carbamoyl-phosphate synthase large subunit
MKVMIAGVGGASLGTEIFKSLRLAGQFDIYGCDVSPTAYGLYQEGFAKTYRVERSNYVRDVLNCCAASGAQLLVPGGEQPMVLLSAASESMAAAGVRLLTNSPEAVALLSDKHATFRHLAARGVAVPRTIELSGPADVQHIGLPCIVKPATGSGGSVAVFFAVTSDEAMVYAEFIRRMGSVPIAQEYVDDSEGEFTIGVLSLPDGRIAGSIALRRALDAKLSVAYRGRGGVISSGYSQGYIDHYPDLCAQAEAIAVAVASRGPVNIQGRVRGGVLLPFEINPRFSASTYLRAMAGFNEVATLIECLTKGTMPSRPTIRPGWYLRSLTEQFVSSEVIR